MKQEDRTPETESSSASNTLHSSPKWKYDVFLSFAGKDTRLNFTDHLYDALRRGGINAFRDNEGIERGQFISDQLPQAIKDSLCALVVLSENYADSKWCLEELQMILDCRTKLGQQVFPIFCDVDPSDVRHQRQNFGEALAKHEKKFGRNEVQNWRNALSEIGSIAGWTTSGRHEADLIKDIVRDVWSFLSTTLPCFKDNLVGIDLKVADVIPFLEIGLDDKRFVGIWGMGGVGKTTLARVVSEKLSDKFEICCFLEKVKDALALPKGLVSLQKSLLSHLQIKDLEIYDSYKGMQTIRCWLREKKVLLVLDDVDDMSQLKDLAESPDWFGEGSRIIITTRDRHVLTSIRVESIYEMKTMKNDESLQIFSKKAFNKNHPEEKYLEYSNSVVKHAGGLPLALEALGSYFCGRSGEAMWRDALEKLKQINPHKNILEVLKISYDGLDEKEQTIFLDIVCLFKYWKKEVVTQILKACDLNPILGINVLIEKTLLVENEYGRLDMHDLYEELGWHIIQQKFPNSRLGKFEEVKEVLENNKGSREIEAIVMGNEYPFSKIIEVHSEAFSKMRRIRLLFLDCKTKAPTGLKKLSGALKFLRWPFYPLEALPLPLDEIVHIEMPGSNIKQLWNGIKSMNHLKFINLTASSNLTETPDFSNVQSLVHLCLVGCTSLVKVHESLGVLKELVVVDLYDCENLNSLPSKLETKSLRMLDLCGCKNVKKLPEFGEGMKKLFYLDASYTAITGLPESFGSLTGLRFLNLSGNGFRNLPTDCFSSLFGLVFLSLEGCKWLVSLPRLPPRLTRLEATGCYSMECSLDEQLLDWVTSLDHEGRGQTKYVIFEEGEEYLPLTGMEDDGPLPMRKDFVVEPEYHPLRNFFAIMPSGGKIPSWFYPNIKYYDKRFRCEFEIEVEVPPNFRASKWSGIVVCLQIKGPANCGMISWSSKAPEDDGYKRCVDLPHGIWRLHRDDNLWVMVLEFNQETCWQHLRGDNNSLHIQLSSGYNKPIFAWWMKGILGYGWRVICKEDIQKWCHPNHFNQFTQPQHAPPSEVKLHWQVLRRLLGFGQRLSIDQKKEFLDNLFHPHYHHSYFYSHHCY